MANLISGADGLLTAAATWRTTDSTGLVEPATLGATALTTGNLDSAVFVPGAITVDGVAIRLANRAAGAPANTMTITLRNSTAGADIASVTVNVSDLAVVVTANLDGGWYFFKFDSAKLLVAGNNYLIRATLSATSTAVSLVTNNTASNWLHMLRTTTTAAPAAGDNLHIMGEFDGAANPATTSTRAITMDEIAATDYGSANVITNKSSSALDVNNRATLTWDVTAATAFQLRLSGNLNVYSGGTFQVGDTGAKIPRDSTAVLEFDPVSADGDFGLLVRNGATFTAYGLSRTAGKDQWMAKLIADSLATDTTLDVDTDTGWLAGDEIGIAPTAQTATHFERRTLDIDAGAALLTVTAGLSNPHLGSGDYFAEVVLLTRNVEIRSTSTTLVTFLRVAATATVVCQWVSFRYIGSSAQPFQIETTAGGSCSLQYCVVQDLDGGLLCSGATHGGWTIDQTVIYNARGAAATPLTINLTSGTWTLTDVIVMGSGGTVFGAVRFLDVGGTIGNLTICGCTGGGVNWNEATIEGGNGPTFSGTPTWVIHSNGPTNGAGAFSIDSHTRDITFPRMEVWRNGPRGMNVAAGIALDNVEFDGGFWIGNGPGLGEEPTGIRFAGQNPVNDVRFRTLAIASDSTFASHWGCLFDRGLTVAANIRWIDCVFSENAGTRRPVTVADIGCIADVAPGSMCVQGIATNCTFNSSGTPISFYYAAGPAPSRNSKYSAIRCPIFGGVATEHRTYTARGTFLINAVVFDVTPSLEIQPLEGAAVPIDSHAFQPGWGFLVPVLSGQTVTVSVKVQKSAGYNGATEPQLVLLANPQIGIAADAVIDTLSVGSGSFETLTGTTAAAAADGVMEFVVRAYGTAGSVYVDTWGAA